MLDADAHLPDAPARNDTSRRVVLRDVVRQSVLWMLLSFFLNLLWEVAHTPLYTLDPERGMRTLAYAVMHCTVGDALVAFASYVLAAALLRDPFWPERAPWRGSALVVLVGIGWTVYAEWYNVYVTGAWGYTPRMPTLFGIGVSPLLQWLVLPVLAVLIVRNLRRKHCARLSESPGGTPEQQPPRQAPKVLTPRHAHQRTETWARRDPQDRCRRFHPTGEKRRGGMPAAWRATQAQLPLQ